jgi:hypothetical protein
MDGKRPWPHLLQMVVNGCLIPKKPMDKLAKSDGWLIPAAE